MIPWGFYRRVALLLLLIMAFPIIGPLPTPVTAAGETQVTLDADSDTGKALLITGIIIGGIIYLAKNAREKERAHHYEQGMALMEEGQYDEAVAEFEEAGKYSDARVQLEKAKSAACQEHYEWAMEAIQDGNYFSAYRHLQRVTALKPAYRDVPDLLARVKAWLKPFVTVQVAVLDFDNGAGYYNLGRQASSRLINEVVNENLEFVEVVERVKLEQILREQRLWGSGYLDSGSVQEVGKILGVNYLVLGEILSAHANTDTTYTVITDDDHIRFRYRMEREARVSASFRVVNVQTGAVVVSDTATETARDADYSYWRWGFASLDSEEELIQEAMDDLIKRFSGKILKFLEQEVSEGLDGSYQAAV